MKIQAGRFSQSIFKMRALRISRFWGLALLGAQAVSTLFYAAAFWIAMATWQMGF